MSPTCLGEKRREWVLLRGDPIRPHRERDIRFESETIHRIFPDQGRRQQECPEQGYRCKSICMFVNKGWMWPANGESYTGKEARGMSWGLVTTLSSGDLNVQSNLEHMDRREGGQSAELWEIPSWEKPKEKGFEWCRWREGKPREESVIKGKEMQSFNQEEAKCQMLRRGKNNRIWQRHGWMMTIKRCNTVQQRMQKSV